MSTKACSNCRHFEEFSCHIRGVCTKYARATRVEASCPQHDAKRAEVREPMRVAG